MPFRVGGGGGSTTTAGGLVFHGDPGGTIQARDAKSGELLWEFQTGFRAEATPMVYEVDGDQYIAIAAGGNQGVGSANGDAVWTFSLKGQLNPLWPPPPPPTIAGPASGPIADNVDTVKIGDNNSSSDDHIKTWPFGSTAAAIGMIGAWKVALHAPTVDASRGHPPSLYLG